MLQKLDVNKFLRLESERQKEILSGINELLMDISAEERVIWAFENLAGNHALTSSFGIQAAVCLHMYTRVEPSIPVIFIDTGYLFPETYRFADELKKKLGLNLKVYRSELSPSWQEALHGKLWEAGLEGITKFNRLNKVIPMAMALNDLELSAWHSGLRREQSDTRKKLDFLSIQGEQFKFLPILDWTKDDVDAYLRENNLEYHPLYYKGYSSVGDIHTSSPVEDGQEDQQTRFLGLKRECGLHEDYFKR
ncbi:phosphoadenylyl-sulfate reductase [Pseudoalteromonas sp. SSMSWG5]|uniref:phosphoadenylyl-sulfate reductase n=1 Tax=Pseudoalteromonas sp. SSMSWG5 TaxID=3139396 RepID=UPI003BA8FCEB